LVRHDFLKLPGILFDLFKEFIIDGTLSQSTVFRPIAGNRRPDEDPPSRRVSPEDRSIERIAQSNNAMESDPQSPDFTAAMEGIEALAWESLAGSKAESLCEERGIAAGVALFHDAPHPLTNRIVRLGLARPVQPDCLDRIIEKYDEAGASSIFVPLAPTARPSTLPRLLQQRGFKPAIREAKLYRSTLNPPAEDPYIRLVTAKEEDHAVVLDLYRGAGMDHDWAEIAVTNLSSPLWNCYLAMEGSKPVALATMLVSDGFAWCTPGWTLPAYRGRGHQRALMVHRIAAAAELGCNWVSANLDVTDDPIGFTMRSYTRFGFELLYVRTTYVRVRDDAALPDAFSRRLMRAPESQT
jgi:GNAT superfamily N-acetyltransferase